MSDLDPRQLLQTARELDSSGQCAEAFDAWRLFLEAVPGSAEAWSEYSGVLIRADRLEEARGACAKALRLDRTCLSARINSACALMRQGRRDVAQHRLRMILARHPGRNDARYALADCLFLLQAYGTARLEFEEVLRHEPGHLDAHRRLIQIFHRLGMWPQLREEIDRRLRVEPSCVYAEFESGYLSLQLGELPGGWKGYETRSLVDPPSKPKPAVQQPRWTGEPFAGKTLLLIHEQGFGDTLMFLRYAPMVKALGGRVLLQVQPGLADLAATCLGIDAVIPQGDPLPPFDLQLPMLSLPFVFQTRLDTIPAGIPYLQVPERVPKREVIARILAATDRCTRIGLTWSGNAAYANDVTRSIPADALKPFASLDNAFFFGFHVEPLDPPALPCFVSLKKCISNFSDTAYAMSGMDLMITVDTAMAHLAGAMGLPTLLLLPFSPDWRWMLGRDDSPWYPSMRLYRQSVPGDWEEVIERVVADLSSPAKV